MNTQTNDVVPAPAKAAKKVQAPRTEPKGPIRLTGKKREYKAGSARALWYGALVKANGKTPEQFVEAATKTPRR